MEARLIAQRAVVYDFVDILLDALEARGLHYQVVARVVNNDLEFPMYTGTGPLPFDDIRYTDQDVILARADVAVTNPVARNFAAAVPLAIGGVQVQLRRGWVAVDADVGGHLIRFANSHLEVQTFRPVQEAQARELTSWLADSPLPVVLVGDFNSAANADAPAANRTDSYNILLGAGYFDIWTRGNGQEAGLTCCQAPNLRNPTSELTQRLDLILVNQKLNHFVGGAQMDVVGEESADRTPSGLWPSDHAGVVATLHLPRGRVW
jgi:endonuclease/exonuclease/phosphatase family metal-dependent hydrolase